MPLRLIGAGFGRTGTASTQAALNQLGYRCYHMAEVFANKDNGDLDFWRDVSRAPAGSQHDWELVFANYTATVDFPAACVWRELIDAYPDAKVILTLHPGGPDAWTESVLDTIYFTESRWQFKVLEALMPSSRKFGGMCRRLIWQRSLKGALPDRAKAAEQYRRHIEEVTAAVPADRLLVFSPDQGWEPLCAFLGEAVPPTPFPKVNDRAEMKRSIARMERRAYLVLAGAGFAVVALGAVLARAFRWFGEPTV